jgi:hypothetical protein
VRGILGASPFVVKALRRKPSSDRTILSIGRGRLGNATVVVG